MPELRGFQRVCFEAGGDTSVSFALGFEEVRSYGIRRREVEPGEFRVLVGLDSSAELTDSFRVRAE